MGIPIHIFLKTVSTIFLLKFLKLLKPSNAWGGCTVTFPAKSEIQTWLFLAKIHLSIGPNTYEFVQNLS